MSETGAPPAAADVAFYPTARAVAAAACGAPVAAAVAAIAPRFWLVGPAWLVLVVALALLDAALAARPRATRLSLTAPDAVPVTVQGRALAQAAFEHRAPTAVEFALEPDPHLVVSPRRRTARTEERTAVAGFDLDPVRRGQARLGRLWARWRGPMGLVWVQRAEDMAHGLAVTLNIQAVKDEAQRLFSREEFTGPREQLDLGVGAEFHALRPFLPGMDRRAIDWKQSARHATLLAKEFRAERNHHVILAIDSGRLMCEPVAGAPRVDHALNAALLLAYVSLKGGDRVGLFGFDARPNVTSGVLSGASAFTHVQHLAAQIDYGDAETNYTLGLTALSARLKRRSLVVVFTDFADSTSAELMLENVGRLLAQHLVLFIVLRDDELESLARRKPETPEDVSRAAVAAALLRERELVSERLRRLGVQIIEARADRIGPALLARYFELKRKDVL
ncbi:DUF58 domain-containing protein [Phenylobacterium montanum]|uniref:DUF58 domain-containing protein n=1 Tax=Phenylobacterium montanum TaxID=2823693 RepID=A0A975ISU9_9CAUL|nr:DUF58 domain-containing protein [Caulobacter sp. S6]QUD86192.1 DUF58 domain-containing protein [Caulobacter sp. S6]